jgi:hypothetical protein
MIEHCISHVEWHTPRDDGGEAPLSLASRFGHVSTVCVFLQRDVSIESRYLHEVLIDRCKTWNASHV